MLRLGSHVSMKAPDMLLGSANEAASYGANTFMIYTGAPQNTRRKPIDELKIDEAQPIIEAHDLRQIVVHAPYIINLGNTKKPGYFEFTTDFLYQEIQRADAVGATQLTLHPGAHIGAGANVAITQIIKGLNAVIRPEQHVQIALETMAGKGTEVGRTFEELAQMIDGVTYNEKLSVTFDTCHTSDAGYAIKDDFDGVLNEFDHVIGLDRLKVIHLNDSKNPQGAHKDRHTNISMGTIGFDTLNKVAHHPQLPDISKILETPYVGEDKKHQLPPYKYEIAMLRAGQFNPHLIEDIEQQR